MRNILIVFDQKKSILLEWELDAQAILRADEENMCSDEMSMLSRVHRALVFLEEDHLKAIIEKDQQSQD